MSLRYNAITGEIGLGSAGTSNSFETISCPSGTSPVADSSTDTLTLTSSNGSLTVTGDSSTDTINFDTTIQPKRLVLYTECTEPASFNAEYTTGAGNGGSITYDVAPELDGSIYHLGIISLLTGTTGSTSSRAYIWTGFSTMCLGGGVWRFITYIKTPAALSDASNVYQIQAGFSDSVTSWVDVANFYYTHTSSANWMARTIANSVATTTDTGIAVATSTWVKLEVQVNAAGSSVGFYIADALVATHTTNIPTGVARNLGSGVSIRRNDTNTTSRTLSVDMVYTDHLLTTSR